MKKLRERRKEIHEMGGEEIAADLSQLREKLYTLRTQSVTEKVEDNTQFRKTRRDIARLLTEATKRASRNEL
jgi:ribosomal protein L29